MIAEFSILPIGKGDSVGDVVSGVMKIIDTSGLPYRVNPMGTVVEGKWDDIMALIKKCHDEGIKNSKRVVTSIRIDDRPGKPMDRLTEKVGSLERRLGKELKK